MYNVTLVRLSSDAQVVDPEAEDGVMAYCSSVQLSSLLEAFSQIDPMLTATYDPEIRIYRGRDRFIVRTSQGRLLLYDGRDRAKPGFAVTIAGILAELEGTGRAADYPAAEPSLGLGQIAGAAASSAAVPKLARARARRIRLVIMSVLVVALGGGIVALRIARAASTADPAITPIPPAEHVAAVDAVAGVYVTGSEPGHRGIVIGADGTVRIFQLNASTPPSMVTDTWRAARRGPKPLLLLAELQTTVEIIDRDTVAYCGETYRRAAPP